MEDYEDKSEPPDTIDPDEAEMEQVAEDMYIEMMIDIERDKHVIHND